MVIPDWRHKPTLTGDLVRLRPFVAADAEAMREVVGDAEVIKLTGSAHGPDQLPSGDQAAEDARLRDWYANRGTVDQRLDLAVVDRRADAVVGEVVLNKYDAANSSCNFRILLGPRGRGRGFGTEATRLIVGYGFEALELHRISLDVLAFNPRARRVYEKVGFVTEGISREAFRWSENGINERRTGEQGIGSQWIDEERMAILDHEWARHHGYPTL